MIYVYTLVIGLIFTASAANLSDRLRVTVFQTLIFCIIMTAPLSLMRDVPQYMLIIGRTLDPIEITEEFVKLLMALFFCATLETMFRTNYGIGSIASYIFVSLPTVACNQLRLSVGILIFLQLQKKFGNKVSILASAAIHQSLVLNLIFKRNNEKQTIYILYLSIVFALLLVGLIYSDFVLDLLNPYLGNLPYYLEVNNHSDIYRNVNHIQGYEFVICFVAISMLANSLMPFFLILLAFLISNNLDFLPVVITGRFFELFCYLYILNMLPALKVRLIPILILGSVLLLRLKLHFSI